MAIGAAAEGVRPGGWVIVMEGEPAGVEGVTTVAIGGMAVDGVFATALLGGGGGGVAFAGISPA